MVNESSPAPGGMPPSGSGPVGGPAIRSAFPPPPPALTGQPAAAPDAGTATPPAASGLPFRRPASAPSRIGLAEGSESDLSLTEALQALVAEGGSDLHLTVGAPPTIRKDGQLRPLKGFAVLEAESLRRTLFAILTQKQRERFEADLELDFAYTPHGSFRYRVNLFQQKESVGAVLRQIPTEIKSLESLGVPASVGHFANQPRGLVLVTGPTGSGKSTTLAAVIDLANRTRSDHIMTVEDPIEFLHSHKMSLVNQREVGTDTWSFSEALKHVLRQDPDIVLVGELRDLETISTALTAAETGHLVFATLHTQDAAQTVDRIIDVFPADQQDQIRTQLAGTLQGVVSQTLCKRSDGPGRIVATEVLVATPGVRNLIREGKTHQIYSAMQSGQKQGMHTMDQHLAELVRTSRISYETGLAKCHHIEDFNRLTGRQGGAVGAGLAAVSMGAEVDAAMRAQRGGY